MSSYQLALKIWMKMVMIDRHKIIRVLAIVFMFLTSSCSSPDSKMEDGIAKAFSECKQESICVIDFKEIVSVDWDTMHVLGESVGQSLANKLIGFEYKEGKTEDRLILFVKGDTVVQSQSDFLGFDDSQNSKIFFSQQTIANIKSSDAKFNVSYKEGIYSLSRIQ